MNQYDLIVIGSGPGGYVAAIKAAKLGMKTAIIESGEIGGTCLNRGCIPTKTLMHSSHIYQEAKQFSDAGISFEGLSYDMEKILNRKEEVVVKNRQGIVSLLEANGVTIIHGRATIVKEHLVRIQENQKETGNGEDLGKDADIALCQYEIEADKILIAAGARPVIPRIPGTELTNVVTSDELLSQKPLYQKLLIIGGGVIGIEFASIYSDFGCEVEIIEAMDRIVPNLDKEISQSLSMSLKKKGVMIHTKAKVTKISKDETKLICEFEEKETTKTTAADGILLAVGRRAWTEGLFAPDLPVDMEGSCIRVNSEFETSIPGIYAIGDVIQGKQLAHAASAQGIAAVEIMCGKKPSVELSYIPSCIYTSPEVAVVGLSEEEALQQGFTVKTGKYPMLGNSRTLIARGERGFIKVIVDSATDKILGAQLLCDRATDMISEFTTAMAGGLTIEKMASVIRPHPTYSEAVTEAVEDAEGIAIHLLPRKK